MRAAGSSPLRSVWLVALALLAVSCSSSESTNTTAATTIPIGQSTTSATSGGGDLRTVRRDQPAITAAAGERFVIELPSNATTGYAWVMTVANDTIVGQVGHEYVSPDTTAVGAGGVERFTYQARSSGTTAIEGEYRRSFEPGVAAADTVSFAVTVGP